MQNNEFAPLIVALKNFSVRGEKKMRKRRDLIDGASYHVTSRTNGKTQVFLENLGRKVLLLTIEEAKEKYDFKLHNFCIMTNHFHLLITPVNGTNLSRIVQWIKTNSAKRWNCIFKSKDHLWGERFFSRPIKDMNDFYFVKEYIDQNPVKSGYVKNPQDWKYSGAYYIVNEIEGLVDYNEQDKQKYYKK